jgi:uncharacterized coiled-coil protein SlyX
MKILYTIKEYAKIKNLTDTAIRKQIAKNQIQSVELDQIYVVVEDNKIKDLQSKIRLLNAKIKELKAQNEKHQYFDDYVNDLKDRIKVLENRIIDLENKLLLQVSKKEELYEKVIGTMLEHKPQ